MRGIFLVGLLIPFVAQAATAGTYLVFMTNQDGSIANRPDSIWVGPAPSKAQIRGGVAIPWVPVSGHQNPNDYYRQNNNTIQYVPEEQPIVQSAPSPEKMLDALAADPTVSLEAYMLAERMSRVKTATKMREVYSAHSQKLDPEQHNKLDAAAQEANMSVK
jgi:hypothetical protein